MYMRKNASKKVDMAFITFFERKTEYPLLKKHVTTLCASRQNRNEYARIVFSIRGFHISLTANL